MQEPVGATLELLWWDICPGYAWNPTNQGTLNTRFYRYPGTLAVTVSFSTFLIGLGLQRTHNLPKKSCHFGWKILWYLGIYNPRFKILCQKLYQTWMFSGPSIIWNATFFGLTACAVICLCSLQPLCYSSTVGILSVKIFPIAIRKCVGSMHHHDAWLNNWFS